MATPFNAHFQALVCRLLITDDDFCRMVWGRLEPKHFTSSLAAAVAQLCLAYFAEFRESPKDHFYDEFARHAAGLSGDLQAEAATYVANLRDMPRPNREYILRRINDSLKLRVREEAALQFAQLIGEGQMEEADNVMYKALRSGLPDEEEPLDYLTDLTALTTRQERPDYLVHTGVPALDRVFGGFSRGQLVSYLGGQKAGKTWALQWLARQCLNAGLGVLHVSHEVGQDEMELRYDMMFTGRGKRDGKVVELPRRVGDCVEFRELTVRTVYDADAVRRGRKAARSRGGRLLIKKYPMGTCTTQEIERLLNYLESYHGFLPDVLINDYVDIMDLTGYGKEVRHQINAGYVWSKGLADSRNILVATASQLNREGLERRHIRRRHVGEDIRKLANVDAMLAIGRSPEDVRAHLAGLSILVSRGETQDVGCTFVPCFDVGQFCLDSWLDGEIDEGEGAEEITDQETEAEKVKRTTGVGLPNKPRLD